MVSSSNSLRVISELVGEVGCFKTTPMLIFMGWTLDCKAFEQIKLSDKFTQILKRIMDTHLYSSNGVGFEPGGGILTLDLRLGNTSLLSLK